MSKTISLADIDTGFQDKIKNTVGSPLSQVERVRIFNNIIQTLQVLANWDPTKRIVAWDYLRNESDYSIVNDIGITDFKDVKVLRDPNKIYERFAPDDEGLVDEYIREQRVVNTYAVEERDNADILRVIYRGGNAITKLANMNSLTEDGTWSSDTTDSDATTLTLDTTRTKVGSGSFNFNIDVSQSGNNKANIRNTTLTPVDLTNLENIGHFRAWLDFRQLTAAQLALIDSVEIRFGDDTSNYWAITVTSAITGGSFVAGWNRVSWDWNNATKTSSPTVASINYFELIINFGATMTDANNVRWDDLIVIEPVEMEMVYFSEFFVEKSGVKQLEFTTSTVDTTEVLMLPSRYRDTFLHLVVEYGFRQLNDESSQEYIYHQIKGDKLFKMMKAEIGNDILKSIKSIRPRGTSSGRIQRHRTQW